MRGRSDEFAPDGHLVDYFDFLCSNATDVTDDNFKRCLLVKLDFNGRKFLNR